MGERIVEELLDDFVASGLDDFLTGLATRCRPRSSPG
jgi:hypothetical protein